MLAFGGPGGPEGDPRDLHKSASDPAHIMHGLQGMGSLTWVSPSMLPILLPVCAGPSLRLCAAPSYAVSCRQLIYALDVLALQSDLAALGHSGVPPAMQSAIER